MSLATKCWTFVLRQCQFRARFFLTIVFLFTFLGQNSFSQSLEQLEAEILGSSPDFDEVIPEADPEADSQSKEDDYAFSEVTEQEHLEQNLEAEEDALEKVDELVKGPRQIPFEHILVVQNKYVQKEGSHEITPFSIAIQPADSFRKQLQMGLSYAYHVNDSFALELLHLLATTNLKSGFSEELLDNTCLLYTSPSPRD